MKWSKLIEPFALQNFLWRDSRGHQIGTLDKGYPKGHGLPSIFVGTVAGHWRVWTIIVKHAPIFRPIRTCQPSANQIYIDLIKHDIAVYVSHTNIDIVENGLNDWFCQMLGIEGRLICRKQVRTWNWTYWIFSLRHLGIGPTGPSKSLT